MNSTRYSHAWGWARPFALALPVFAAIAASAQTQPANAADSTNETLKLEKFVVTGSNIPSAAEALSVPVTVISSKQFDQSGVAADMLDLLRKAAPSISGIGEENAQTGTGTNFGGASLTIKGLGTLVLVNGRRVAFSPAESTGGFQFVDLNLIPVAAVQQIEVLTDGASAIYGSDAVGGVINIILKRDYNGWEVGGHYGFSSKTGHYRERSGYIVGGASNDKSSVTVALDYTQHDAMYLKDRPYTNPIYGTRSYPGIIDVTDLSTGNDQFYQLKAGLNAPPGGGTYTIQQLVANGTYSPLTSAQALQVFNLANAETMQGYLKRYSAVMNFNHKIFGENLEIFGDALATNTRTWSSLNAQPLVPYLEDPYIDINAVFGFTPPPAGTTYVPTTSPANPFSTAYVDQAADGNTGNLIFVRNRFIDFPRVYDNNSTLFRAVAGVRGKVGENYTWEVAANLNKLELDYTNNGVIATVPLQNALNSGAINPWAIKQAAGALDGIVGTAFVNMFSTLNTFDAKFAGTPVDLPGGKLGFALGASYMREALGARPDTNSLPNSAGTTQGWSNATTFKDFEAARKVRSYYAEAEVPIIGPSQNIPAVHVLNADLAVRYDKYDGAVGASTDPKYSLSWQPVDDTFKVRASAGKSFIAPLLYNLYGPVTSGASQPITYTSKNGVQFTQVQFNATGGSNPDLKPSTATNWTVGFVYTPKQVEGLSVTIDYSEIKQKSIPGVIPQQQIIQDVENNGTASPYINLIHLNNPTGALLTGPGQVSSHSQQSIWIINQLLNLGGSTVKSTDLQVEYAKKFAGIGKIDLTTTLTYYNSYQLQIEPGQPFYEYAGQATAIIGGAGTVPRYRFYTVADWQDKGWDFFVAHSFIAHVNDTGTGGATPAPAISVASYQQFDAGLSYDFKNAHIGRLFEGLKITFGVNNVFDKAPPLAPNAFQDTNADLGTYNGAIGRMYYINAKLTF